LILDSINELERKYSGMMEKTDKLHLNVSTRASNDGIYDWFPMVQRFTWSFLSEIFKGEELKESQIILDPFMGSGNTLVACLEFGKKGYGVDVSPFFWFITHVKTSEYSVSDFGEAIDEIGHTRVKKYDDEIPELSSFATLFDRERLCTLFKFKNMALGLDSKAKELLLFALVSELINFSMATRYGKGLRKEKLKKPIDVETTLRLKLMKMKKDYELFNQKTTFLQRELFPLLGDARSLNHITDPTGRRNTLPKGQIDCVITSPPYCNSADYVEMYKLEHWFLDCVKSYKEFRELSHSTIRSHTTLNNEKIKWRHYVVEDVCNVLENNDIWNRKIPIMIRAYFDDLHTCLGELKRVLHPKGIIFLLVANSSYGAIPIPTDLLLAEAANSVGFYLEKINIVRPFTTSGQQWRIMDSASKKLLRESILILRPN